MRTAVPVAFRTLGCKVNQVESEGIAADLLGRGAYLAPEADARVIVLNTCTVTGEADRKARKSVRQALKLPGRPVVVVTGCLAALDSAGLAALGERVVVEPDKQAVAGIVARLLGLDTGAVATAVRAGAGFHTRAMLKIEDGCDGHCAYCIVPFARGLPRAVPLDALRAEAERLVASGVSEIVLTGINIGRYSHHGRDLADVVGEIAATGVSRLRLSSIEPTDLSDRLLDVLSATPAACPHMHVPLQTGSDSVLAEMGRSYDMRIYEAHISAAREAVPGLCVTTDVIAGLPGETAADHELTLAACERIGFSKLHVFRYSRREGTRAASMPVQVPAREISARAAELRVCGERLRTRFLEGCIGREVELLVERELSPGVVEGTSPEYARVRVAVSGGSIAPGTLMYVTVLGVNGGVLEARP